MRHRNIRGVVPIHGGREDGRKLVVNPTPTPTPTPTHRSEVTHHIIKLRLNKMIL